MPNTPYGQVALAGELDKLSRAFSGGRNHELNTRAFKIFQLVENGHIDQQEAEQKIWNAIRPWFGQPGSDGKPFTESEARNTINSAKNGSASKPRQNVPDPKAPKTATHSSGGDLDSRLAAPTPDVETSTSGYDDMYLPRSALSGLPQAESWIEGVLDKRTLFSITGRGGTYKSFLGLAWLASLATGQDWLGRKVTQGRVLYVVGEGLYGLNARLTAWETAWGAPIPDDAFHVRRAPVNLFRRDVDVSDLYARIQRERYDVILFDTLQRSSTGADANQARDAGLIVATMGQLQDANPNMSVGYVAHLGKQEEAGTRGSSALEDDLDIVWRLSKDRDAEKVTALLTKRRDGPAESLLELEPSHIEGTDSLILRTYKPLGIDLRHPKYAEQVLRYLAGTVVSQEGGRSQRRLMEELGLTSRSEMQASIQYLLNKGWVTGEGRGPSSRWLITDAGRAHLARMDGESNE